MNFLNNKESKIKNIAQSFGYDIENGSEDGLLRLDREYAPPTTISIEKDGTVWVMGCWKLNQTAVSNNYELKSIKWRPTKKGDDEDHRAARIGRFEDDPSTQASPSWRFSTR